MKRTAEKETTHEPLFHVTKRDVFPWKKSVMIRVIAFAAALLFCALVSLLVIGANPVDFFSAIFKGSFGTPRRIWKLLKDIAILLCISLAVTPAFRMRFWNIGAEGQVLVSALACSACMYYLGEKMPFAIHFGNFTLLRFSESFSEVLLIIIMLVCSIAAGALWGLIPAVFKALWNTNETLFTLMMNYVATYLVAFALIKWTPDGSSSQGILPHGHLPKIFNEYLLIIIVVLVLMVGMYIYLNTSKHGYEVSVVGESEKTARYIGINVKKVVIRTMVLSGAICGLAGFLIVGGLDHSVTTETVGGRGFTAIMVSWLAKFNPFLMLLTSFLLVFLDQGAAQISQDFDISSAFPDIVVGIILFFIIGSEFFIRYKLNFRKSHKKAAVNEKTEGEEKANG